MLLKHAGEKSLFASLRLINFASTYKVRLRSLIIARLATKPFDQRANQFLFSILELTQRTKLTTRDGA
jgi:hypothetical protein